MARTLYHDIDPEEMFRTHQKTIWKAANNYAASTGIDVSDFESIGNEVFLRCLTRWDPERASFNTLLYRMLRNAFNNHIAEEAKVWKAEQSYEPVPYSQPEAGEFWLKDFLIGLSPDAIEVVRILFNESLTTIKEQRFEVRRAIRQHLRNRSRTKPKGGLHIRWSPARIRASFKELEGALISL